MMTPEEITTIGQVLKENFSLCDITTYGIGAIDFRGHMIEFRARGLIMIRGRFQPCASPPEFIQAMAKAGLIRQQSIEPLIERINKQLKTN